MRAVIIEDEPLVAKDLRNALAEIAPEIDIIAELDSLATAPAFDALVSGDFHHRIRRIRFARI